MAIADSNTPARPEITGQPLVIAGSISTLLKTPLGATHDLFQVLDVCQSYADALIENNNHTECIALCGRLLAGLSVLKVVLQAPLPDHLIKSLTVDITQPDNYRCALTTDSETLREYCASLTIVLLNQLESPEQQEHIIGILFELVSVLAEDLKAPRFVRTSAGLVMMSGETVSSIH